MFIFLFNWILIFPFPSIYSFQVTSQELIKKYISFQNRANSVLNFKHILSKSKNIVILTGEGLTREGGYAQSYPFEGWSRYAGIDLQTEMNFMENPFIFWELYQHRRNSSLNSESKKVHKAIASAQKRYLDRGLNFTVATVETDELLQRAGVQNVIELHGSLFKTRCVRCFQIISNYDNPITEGLRNKTKGSMDNPQKYDETSKNILPQCKKPKCGGILRPHVWWRGDQRHENVWEQFKQAIDNADFYITMGISSQSPPIRTFFDMVSKKKIPTCEFGPPKDHNLMIRDEFSPHFMFEFPEFCEKSVPPALSDDELNTS